ncbi:MAG: DUF6057 family protein, partial [Candidatus Latescibacterota bacterium]
PEARLFAGYHRLYRRGQWDALLQRASRQPLADPVAQFMVNHALCQQGRLLEGMFHYPQVWGTRGLLLDLPDFAAYARRALYDSDAYFALGHVNAAYKLAYNDVYVRGETYGNLRRIAECMLANGNVGIAAKYLRILEGTLFHRTFARQYQKLLADPDALDRRFAELRSRRPTVEVEVGLGDYACLLALVESNPRNRMAFDYLAAWCLLDKAALPLVAENPGRFREVGYPRLPAHAQEALLVWGRKSGTRAPGEAAGVETGTRLRFQRFEQEAQRYAGRSAAEVGLRPAFGNTYMYYYLVVPIPLEGAAASNWLTLGNELYVQGETEDAISCFRQALLRDPRSSLAHARLAEALSGQGQGEEAHGHYLEALRDAPDSKQAERLPYRADQMPSH